jgi:inorganic pyrophosphatase
MTSAGLSASARRNGLRETTDYELSMNLDYISIGRDPPEEVNAVIEVPIGGEPINHPTHPLRRWRSLRRHDCQYPADSSRCRHRRAAERRAQDDGQGCGDEKIVAVPIPKLTQRYADVRNYTDLPEITWRQIEHFLAHYKDLEVGKWVTFAGWGERSGRRSGIPLGRPLAPPFGGLEPGENPTILAGRRKTAAACGI